MENENITSEELAADVVADYERRRTARRRFEAQWRLNMNFVLGNQFCSIGPSAEVTEDEKDYFWQEREVFNHIASVVDTRLAKLGRVRPVMSVRPASGDDCDIKTAQAASKILKSAQNSHDFDSVLSDGTMWSEITGSVFYKIAWDDDGGAVVGSIDGRPVHEGDVKIEVCPPYEIYPDDLTRQDVKDLRSIIHARAVPTDEIERVYGVRVESETGLDVIEPSLVGGVGGLFGSGVAPAASRGERSDCALVIERYDMPSEKHPLGAHTVVSNGKLLYCGELPYESGEGGARALPFVKQDSMRRAGCFFGTSMVERTIPLQRAYNAVKNRKHEFLNRIAMGVLTVEDGSVDVDDLADEGLSPGKIIVYRQGSQPPRLMNCGDVPSDFAVEEERLLNEFISVSGVSEIMRSSSVPSGATSGVALQLLIEQDDTRLSVSAELVRKAAREIARKILRLYRQFATRPRLIRFVGENGDVELMSFVSSDISCDDVVFDTENELSETLAMRQNTIFELLSRGLLSAEDGRLDEETKYKVLDTLGYGGWESKGDARKVHVRRAEKENMTAKAGGEIEPSELDDHELHIARHTSFALTDSNFGHRRGKEARERLIEHIRRHKALIEQKEGAVHEI